MQRLLRRPQAVSRAAGIAALALLSACSSGDPRPARPNVIVVVVDTLRADRLAAYGHTRPTSPWLNELATQGVLFEDATAQSGWTLPSMVSLFTGRYLTAYAEAIAEQTMTLPEVFQAAGWRTVGVVANLSINQHAGFDRGFDVFDLRAAPPQPGDTGDRPRTIDELSAHLVPALDRAEELPQAEERPLFLFFFPYDPHDPYYKHPHLDDAIPPLETDSPSAWQRSILADHPATPPTEDPDWEKHLAHIAKQRGFYDQEVRHTDDVLARTFEELGRRGLLENSVVAFVADHGEGLWEHVALKPASELAAATPLELFYQKHGAHLFQEAIATPFVLSGAGIPAGERISTPIENVDLFPTLLALAGLPPVPGLHGHDLSKHMGGGPAPAREYVHSFLYHQLAVREVETGWKLLHPTDVEKRVEPVPQLFHLPDDPDERQNLYADRELEARRLEEALRAWTERYSSPDAEILRSTDEQLEILRALGYTDEDIGARETLDPPR